MRYFLPISKFLVLCIMLTSCSHSYYVASPTNVPLLTHKGDAKINVDLANATRGLLGTDAVGVNLSGSYAIGEKMGIMGSGSIMGKKFGDEDDVEKLSIQNFEVGIGFINTWISQNFLFEVFTGTGYIAQQHYKVETGNNQTLKIHSIKYFLQPNIALKKNDFFSLAFSPKLVWVKNSQVERNFDPPNYEFGQNTGLVYFEPTIDLRVGRLVKFRFQIKYVHAFEKPVLYYSNIIISMGFQVELDDLFSEKENKEGQKTTK